MDDVETMGRNQLMLEVRKLRNAITKVVTQRGDEICWRDVYTDLAGLVPGLTFDPELLVDPGAMADNCTAFIKSMYSKPYRPVYVELRVKPKRTRNRNG